MSSARKGSRRGGPRLLAPEVVQSSAMDCGPAALKCILQGFGVPVSYDRLREACQTGLDGTSIDTLESVAPTELFRVFMFIPEIEVIFFEAPRALERLLGKPVSAEAIQEGLLVPKQTLDRLLKEADEKRTSIELVGKTDPETARELAASKQAAALMEAVRSFVEPTVSAAR